MEGVWFSPNLSDEIIKNDEILGQIDVVVLDLLSRKLNITKLVENMGGVLTDKDAENRKKGMIFFTKLLKELPKDYLSLLEIVYISKFYIDRLKDNHSVIPPVLEGYAVLIDMENYNVENSAEFFLVLFREVPCQTQIRQDRYNIYLIIQKILHKNISYLQLQGPDFVYGVMSAIEGERDPRNLLFLFNFLPKFLSSIPLGHLVEEMFDILSCYFPIDFHPSPNDPAAVSRQELADALCPCLCATPDFGEHCLLILIEKLDSDLRVAKVDSLKLLAESCKTFKPEIYGPFLKTLWASINREITQKTDNELRVQAHNALSSLVTLLSTTANTDLGFENFVKGVIICMQGVLAASTIGSQFYQASKVLLTTANASKQSCLIVTKIMMPSAIAYYGFTATPKLQLACIEFLGQLYDLAKHWEVVDEIKGQVGDIPDLCLQTVSQPSKEFQLTGFRTLIRLQNEISSDLVLPLVEILIHNIQNSLDNDLLSMSVEMINVMARRFPELIMDYIVKGKCNLDNITEDKSVLHKRLSLLCNLASIDDFTKVIIKEMLNIVTNDDDKENAHKVVEALNSSMSNINFYSEKKVNQIDSDHGLINSIIAWLLKEINEPLSLKSLEHGFSLVSTTMSSLPTEKQVQVLNRYTKTLLLKSDSNEDYFLILQSLYISIQQNLYNDDFIDVMLLSLKICLNCEKKIIKEKAGGLVAHLLNKVEYGGNFESLYKTVIDYLASRDKEEAHLCTSLVPLFGWMTKSLILRGSDLFTFWLQKILVAISCPQICNLGSAAIKLIMENQSDYLTAKQHCRISLLYKQRMYQTFMNLSEIENFKRLIGATKEAYLLSSAYIIAKVSKSLLTAEAAKIAPLVIDSLDYNNKELLAVMVDVASHLIINSPTTLAGSLQTILPRLVNLTLYVNSMDVRIKSLLSLYDIACVYPTSILLPYKQDLLLDIAPSLDDKKRLVRNMAVKARTRWFLVGAPGEPKDN